MKFGLIFMINFYICGINAFIPPPRAEVTATLVNNRIYFNGGWNGSSSSDVFFLDVSLPFTTNDIALMPWTDLSFIPGLIIRSGHTACMNGINNNLIVYIGGAFMKETDSNFTSVFDITTQKWSIPVTSGNLTSIERIYIHCVSLGNGIYVYGGGDSVFSMMKLDVSNFVWSTLPEMKHLLGLKDTSIMVLDTLKFLWSVAAISNIGGSSSSLFSFSSTLVGAYVLIAFGRN
ncbi:22342_t:CDS:2, partial [Cetraspora pellucida]